MTGSAAARVFSNAGSGIGSRHANVSRHGRMTLGGYNCRAVFLLEGRAVGGDIEIEIGPRTRGHNYKVRVVRSAAGGEPIGSLKLNVEEILGYRELLESTLLASSV